MDKKLKECETCGEQVERGKIKRIRGLYYCSSCSIALRKKHRQETINSSQEKELILELDKKVRNEYARNTYAKSHDNNVRTCKRRDENKVGKAYIPKRYQEKKDVIPQESNAPIEIKGSILAKPKVKSNSYLTLLEQQDLLKIFMSYGNTFEEAKEKVNQLRTQLKIAREKMKENTEEEYQISKDKLLGELWKT